MKLARALSCLITFKIVYSLRTAYLNELIEKRSVLAIPPEPSEFGDGTLQDLQIPFDLEITTDADVDHCVTDDNEYCFAFASDTDKGDGSCTRSTCTSNIGCQRTNDSLLDLHRQPVLVQINSGTIEPINSRVPECGLTVGDNSITFNRKEFPDVEPSSFKRCEPSITLPVNSTFFSYTLQFKVDPLTSNTG